MSIRPVSIVFALVFASLAVAQASTTAASSITPTHAPFQLHLSTGGIVAVTMGSTLGVLLIVIASYFCCCHAACMHARKLKRTQGQMDTKQSVRGCTCKEAKYDAERGIAKDVDVRLDGDVHSTAHIKTQGEEEPGYVRRSLDKKDYDEADEGHGCRNGAARPNANRARRCLCARRNRGRGCALDDK
ncbi:hypothetical protein FB451DRAFT_1568133 [Mycena latifolia]|nr:hypothetical protein FB451DRAFT_1568133 [Mycena latifolia]